MLNGKFYTGLPPKMIDRSGGGTRNRLESHIFWPDDTKVESAVETRVRRRASFQTEPRASAAPLRQPLQRQSSLDDTHNDVNTKQLFHKEFAKSSIQFCDNIPEVGEPRSRSTVVGGSRKSLRQQEIAPKPTATKLELPERVIDKTSKTKHAFHSKIQFYDYANRAEETLANTLNNRSNKLPKMDMNNKREVERNTKNSPKLQAKSNMRNLSATERRNDFVRDQFTPERNDDYEGQRERERAREREFAPTIKRASPQRVIRNVGRRTYEDERQSHYDDDGVEDRSRYATPTSTSNNRSSNRMLHEDDEMNGVEPRRHRPRYEDDHDELMVERSRSTLQSRRAPILKNTPEQRSRNDLDGYGSRERDNYDDMQYVEQNMRRVRVSNSPKKHVTYKDELDDRRHSDHGFAEERMMEDNYARSQYQSNMRTGSNQRRQQYDLNSTPDYDRIESSSPYTSNSRGGTSYYCQRESRAATENSYSNNSNKNNNSVGRPIKKSFNNSSGNNDPHNGNLNNSKQFSNRIASAGQLRKMPTPASNNSSRGDAGGEVEANVDVDATKTAAGMQKHLRSNLNFSNGEIVADNERTPTSRNGGSAAARRTVRSTATSRVSVGLPD